MPGLVGGRADLLAAHILSFIRVGDRSSGRSVIDPAILHLALSLDPAISIT